MESFIIFLNLYELKIIGLIDIIINIERLLFIHDKILTEINYLCMIDNLKNNLPIGIIYDISKFIWT